MDISRFTHSEDSHEGKSKRKIGKVILKFTLLSLLGHLISNLLIAIFALSPSVFLEASPGLIIGIFVIGSRFIPLSTAALMFGIAIFVGVAGFIVAKKLKRMRIFEISITFSIAILSFWLSVSGIGVKYF